MSESEQKTPVKSRVVKTRDTATAILRRLGLKPLAYATFMKQLPGGEWEVDMQKIYDQGYGITATKLAAPKPTTAKVVKPPKAAKPIKAVKTAKPTKSPKVGRPDKVARVSCSSVARELILAGKTNEEVWKVIKEQFKLSDDKRHYPTWYRCQLKRAKQAS